MDRADIVFHDALVGAGVLDLIPPGVRRVGVGKRSGRHSTDQRTINDRLLDAARGQARGAVEVDARPCTSDAGFPAARAAARAKARVRCDHP